MASILDRLTGIWDRPTWRPTDLIDARDACRSGKKERRQGAASSFNSALSTMFLQPELAHFALESSGTDGANIFFPRNAARDLPVSAAKTSATM